MKLSDILISLLIIIVFGGIYAFSILKAEFKNIKKNWPKYRCNPAIMPFANTFGHDTGQNFTYCIQTMQGNYMSYLLTPVHYIMSVLSHMIGNVIEDLNFVRIKIFSLVDNIKNIILSIFSIFINIMIEFQKMIIKIKDIVSKLIGTMVALVYILNGGIMTGESIMAGPIGDTLNVVRKL